MKKNPYADPECPKCKGHGFIYAASLLDGGRYCDCTLDALRLDNMERIWESLSEAKESARFNDNPPLRPWARQSAWITGSVPLFRAHLKATCYNMPTMWNARVRTDAELLDSWFGTAKAQGVKIFDLEVDKSTVRAIDIRDLVEPPDLCIIMLGVKKLPNKEAPGSLLEAIAYRKHLEKPTWIVDQPDKPLDATHRFFSDEVERSIARWPQITLTPKTIVVRNVPKKMVAVSDAVNDVDDMLVSEPEEADTEETDTEEEDEIFEEDVVEESSPRVKTKSFLDTLKTEDDRSYKKGKKKWGRK